jgi:DNA-3-methyladenine glycosylase II
VWYLVPHAFSLPLSQSEYRAVRCLPVGLLAARKQPIALICRRVNPATFSSHIFHALCDELAATDPALGRIVAQHGYPPMWTRPNTFETLVHVILEQQVSLASALAALQRLQARTGGITPHSLLALTDEELRACYVSRQKAGYLRGLAQALLSQVLVLEQLPALSNDAIRSALTRLKGIGNWTVDVYLMFVLQRADIFPIGDLAAVNAVKQLKNLPRDASRETVLGITAQWAHYRTVACMLVWHYYLSAMRRQTARPPGG